MALALKGAMAMPASGAPVLVAFRNEQGELYRYALLEGAIQLRYLQQRLVQLSLLSDTHDASGVLAVLGSFDGSALRN